MQDDNSKLAQDISDLKSDIEDRREALLKQHVEEKDMEWFKREYPDCTAEDADDQIQYLQEMICLEEQKVERVQQETNDIDRKLRMVNNGTQ
ncbi:unnamed protein product [Arabis nemorensis]|uniref:Uncharacterized protein n=1 Tax=Arabis nemorensis TaxID=586526 RepID=A0A565CPL8_9BRAS|nr:unnamed protein product [Arabis nemorensis]